MTGHWVGFLSLFCTSVALAMPPDPLWRAPDPWSLHRTRLRTRALFEQLQAPSHAQRLLLNHPRMIGALDAVVSTQIPRPGVHVSLWHGYFTADTHLAARLGEGMDLNLELVGYQVSASNGYRVKGGVLPGLAGHWYGEVFTLGGTPVWGDLVGLELGELTIGKGLLMERVPSEGAMGRLVWGDWQLEHFIAGQTVFSSDDVFSTRAVWRDLIALDWVVWPQWSFTYIVQYFSLSGEMPNLGPDWRVAWEGAVRLPNDLGHWAGAQMLRIDWLPKGDGWSRYPLHIGYQSRLYQQGYGPWGDTLETARVTGSFPWREDTYVTNAFDYLRPSAFYHQWSHSLMIESQLPVSAHSVLELEVEGRAWFFDDPSPSPRRLSRLHNQGSLEPAVLPETQLDLHYRAWWSGHPLPHQPHRLRLGIGNTYADLVENPRMHTPTRLSARGWFINVEMEAFF